MFSAFLSCLGVANTSEIDGPEFRILKEGEEQYGLSGSDGDTLDLSITSYCWALSQRFSTRADLQNACIVREVHLMREPHRRKYIDPAIPYDAVGGYGQVQDFDRDGVELDWWQKLPENEAEYLVVSGMDRQGSTGHVRLERQWMWERAPSGGGLEGYDYGGSSRTRRSNIGAGEEDRNDMSTWRPRRSVGVPHVIINRQSKLQRHGYGRRDLELGAITFGEKGKEWARERERERGREEEGNMFLYELALLALAVQRIQKQREPWKAESRRRLREGNYARLLFELVEERRHSREVWYAGAEEADRVDTMHEFCADLDKFERKVSQ